MHNASGTDGSAAPLNTEGRFGERYVVERELGRGATAVVYLARDRTTGQQIAIKILRRELATSVSSARFLREIEIGRQLDHPSIIPILDSGVVGDDLYFTMPVATGKTLRERLGRERHIPIAEACAIATSVARALAYAHDRGVIHRDIKPSNILLAEQQVLVADFGIARAVTLAGNERLTESGLAIGTPEYMSPEQATGDQTIDGRADVYALGCVLYEMLAGEPPFTGPTPQAVIARHCQEAPRSIRVVRPSVSVELERVVVKALAKVPTDRFATPGEFAEALADPTIVVAAQTRDLVRASRRRWVGVGVGTAIVAAAAALFAATRPFGVGRIDSRGGRDTALYSVVVSGISAESPIAQQLSTGVREALRQWNGIVVSDSSNALRAGRAVRLETIEDSGGTAARVRATLVDIARDSVVSSASTRWMPGRAPEDSLKQLVVGLLFRSDRAQIGGTTSIAAQLAYLRGDLALGALNLVRADSEFRHATEADPEFYRAFLGLALTRQWSSAPATQWSFAATRASAHASILSPRDREIAAALIAVAEGKRLLACDRWSRLSTDNPNDFLAWYGLGDCIRYDSLVVRNDARSEGWHFRSDYNRELMAVDRALELLPVSDSALSGRVIGEVQRLLYLNDRRLKPGRSAPPDARDFFAPPIVTGDTIAFIPLPAAGPVVSKFLADSAQPVREARVRLREHFLRLARSWRVRYPRSSAGVEAVAAALDLVGNPSALDSLRLARSLARSNDERLRLAGLEVWMLVKYAVPRDPAALERASILADSVLSTVTAGSENANLMASLAALTGRAGLAANFAEHIESTDLPTPLERNAPRLVAFASMGGPIDSLRALETKVTESIVNDLPRSDQNAAMVRWLIRSAALSIPDYRFGFSNANRVPLNRSDSLLSALKTSSSGAVQRFLDDLARQRRYAGLSPATITPDAIYTESAALAVVGDTIGAIRWLTPMLDSIAQIQPQVYADVARAGALVRAFALRAELSRATNDLEAARLWARAVIALWRHPDAFQQPLIDRMRRLAR